MANEDKQHQQNNQGQAESNAERDQDHGNMINGTIGGNMGIIGSSNENANEFEKQAHDGDTGGRETDGSTSGSLGPDGSTDNAGSKHVGSTAEQ